jgi:hypothetical protein
LNFQHFQSFHFSFYFSPHFKCGTSLSSAVFIFIFIIACAIITPLLFFLISSLHQVLIRLSKLWDPKQAFGPFLSFINLHLLPLPDLSL